MSGRPRTIQLHGIEWRCIRCAASGFGLTLDEATLRLIAHNKRVHPEEEQ